MKVIRILFLQTLVLSLFFCGGPDEGAEKACLPPELIVKNVSQYDMIGVYMHDSLDYSGGELVASNMAKDAEAVVEVADNQVKYFTFIRCFSAVNDKEIAVTTGSPVSFHECYKYTLNLLEEDFFLETSDNVESSASDARNIEIPAIRRIEGF